MAKTVALTMCSTTGNGMGAKRGLAGITSDIPESWLRRSVPATMGNMPSRSRPAGASHPALIEPARA